MQVVTSRFAPLVLHLDCVLTETSYNLPFIAIYGTGKVLAVENRESCGLWATHQLDAARELRQTRGPSQPHPTATSCHPQRWRTPTPTFPTAGLPESNRSNPTQRDDGGFRQSDHLRPCPQLLLHMVPAPAHLPRASMWSRERYPPRLHHHPRPPPPASRPASSACVSGTA